MHFLSFQKPDATLGKGEKWLYKEIENREIINFQAETFDYQAAVKDPIVEAMKRFGLNLKEPPISPEKNEAGDIIWPHTGEDTLLLLTTEDGSVSMTAETAQVAGKSFPIVMKMDDHHYMVLLHNVDAGNYRISGQVKELEKAYYFDMPAPELVGAPADGTPMKWYLEDQELTVSLNVPELSAKDVHLAVYVNDVDVPVRESDTENGTQWKVTVPRESLATVKSGSIKIEARKGDPADRSYCATKPSPEYLFEVEDRPLTLSKEGPVEFVYHYHVPGIAEELPIQVNLANYVINMDQRQLTYTPASNEYSIEGDMLTFLSDGNRQPRMYLLQADNGVTAPVSIPIEIKQVDFMDEVLKCNAKIDTTAYEGELGEAIKISFTFPAKVSQLYAEARKQYPTLPEKLEEALQITATITGDSITADSKNR